ncbi:MAG: hypothetical protein ACK58M_11130 [Acidobacteriota bacterium]|jgi:hypothetical protein|nr:hypothetical protein [Bryobacteraceae bacterium CoA2 C42]MCA2964660.1 hypothetical protein [Acidobacteriaceae bacterium]
MKRHFATPIQPLSLLTDQQRVPSSPYGDIPPAILCETEATEARLGQPPSSAVALAKQLINHAVFDQPLPSPGSVVAPAGSLLDVPAPRHWQPGGSWATAPSERSARYFAVYARVSLALQVAMREWIPSLYFDNASRLGDLDLAQGMIAWRASRPAVGEHVDRLCCDILDPEMMKRCYFWVERNIRPVLRTLLPHSSQMHFNQRGFFDPRNTNRILLRLRRSQRGFQMILKAEEDIITQLVKLVSATPTLCAKAGRQPRNTEADIERNVERTMTNIEARLRRIIPHGDCETIQRLLLTVLTTALAESDAESHPRVA